MRQLPLSSGTAAATWLLLMLGLSAHAFAAGPPPILGHVAVPPPRPPVAPQPVRPPAPAPTAVTTERRINPMPPLPSPHHALNPPQSSVAGPTTPDRRKPPSVAARPEPPPSPSGDSSSPAPGRSDGAKPGADAAKAAPAKPSSSDKPDPAQVSSRQDLGARSGQQASTQPLLDKPVALPPDGRFDLNLGAQQATAAKPSSQDKSDPQQAGARQDSSSAAQQPAAIDRSAQDAGDGSQPATASRHPLTADDARLVSLIVQRDRADAQFQQDISAAQARFAEDHDANSYQRALRNARSAQAKRLEPILKRMARLNHTGIASRKLSRRDIVRLAASAAAPVDIPRKRKRCDAAAQEPVCGHDERPNNTRHAPRGTRNAIDPANDRSTAPPG